MSLASHKWLETQAIRAFDPVVETLGPPCSDAGLIVASPHSGRIYPKSFTWRAALPLAALRRNEDAFMDHVIEPLTQQGIPLLKAHFPRCYVDVNRAADELETGWTVPDAQTTPRGAAGLGVIPTMISERLAIYKTPLPKDIVKGRLDALYYPYHKTLKSLIAAAKTRAGHALLLDCHSMPGVSTSGRPRHDIILGDRFGASAAPELVSLAEHVFTSAGYRVARNNPYAGGYVTSTYGQPYNGVSVIQIEVNRNIYMNPVSFKLTKGFDRLQACFINLAAELGAYMRPEIHRAAE